METDPDPCCFPVLDGVVGATTAYGKVRIDTEQLSAISEFCEENGTNTSTFFKVVWSIILNRFTEMDVLYFSVSTSTSSAMTKPETNGLPEKTVSVHKVLINQETGLKDLFENSNSSLARDSHSFPKFNSGLVFIHGDVDHDITVTFGDENDQVAIIHQSLNLTQLADLLDRNAPYCWWSRLVMKIRGCSFSMIHPHYPMDMQRTSEESSRKLCAVYWRVSSRE
jgi:hypothetical protein